MNALVVYGSLINKSELVQDGFPLRNTCPVIVQGFKRVFRQEPSWRQSGKGKERAVLSVTNSRQHWLNGLVISDLDDGLFIDLDKREKGYNRTKVAPSCLRRYDSSYTTPIPRRIYIYAGESDKQNDYILPNTSYLEVCLEGAKQWGERFYNDFLDSSFIRNNALLRTYVE